MAPVKELMCALGQKHLAQNCQTCTGTTSCKGKGAMLVAAEETADKSMLLLSWKSISHLNWVFILLVSSGEL